jgi:TPR repeat protein
MALFGLIRSGRSTLADLIRRDGTITMEILLSLDEIQCRADVVAAGRLLLQDRKHCHDGYDILGPLAAEGDMEAQFTMGNFCEGALERFEQAAIWFKRAADQGHPHAQRNYADMLVAGKGVTRDPSLALAYYEKAADADVPEACFVVGEFYRNGNFVPKDDRRAVRAYKKALALGYQPAGVRLRQFYPAA